MELVGCAKNKNTFGQLFIPRISRDFLHNGGFNMKKYILGGVVLAGMFWFAYYAGGRVAFERCRADMVIRTNESIVQRIQNNQKKQRIVNEETNRSGVRDIRVFLREKYTIGE